MTLKIGINGFGRIGRLVARIAMDQLLTHIIKLLLMDQYFGDVKNNVEA